jgi:endonuclease YncB( thermonuclease family)
MHRLEPQEVREMDPIQILWSAAGITMDTGSERRLVDVTDGDTPNIRMPVRMLSVDTPEVTAGSVAAATRIDQEFVQLVEWIDAGTAPISPGFAAYVRPKLATGKAGTLHFTQGQQASAFAKQNIQTRLTRPNGSMRNLFIRMDAGSPFDDNGRLLAYVAPNYSKSERESMSRRDRATFNLDLIESGWAATFVIYPAIPGELDLPIFIQAAVGAFEHRRGIWAEADTLPAYEYRALEKLHDITKKIAAGGALRDADVFSWRTRYCADMRTRLLHGPEDYLGILPPYRLWIWPKDVNDAISRLNLVPAPRLVGSA